MGHSPIENLQRRSSVPKRLCKHARQGWRQSGKERRKNYHEEKEIYIAVNEPSRFFFIPGPRYHDANLRLARRVRCFPYRGCRPCRRASSTLTESSNTTTGNLRERTAVKFSRISSGCLSRTFSRCLGFFVRLSTVPLNFFDVVL